MPAVRSDAGYELRVTRRCLVEDLGFRESDLAVELPALAEGRTDGAVFLRTFLDQRSKAPEPGDEGELECLAAGTPTMFPLRRGARQRGVTWFDERSGIVWLIAAHHSHRSGERNDSYVYFRGLRREQLLPERLDMVAVRTERADEAANAIWDDVPRLMAEADASRGAEVFGHVGRIPVSMVMTDDLPPHLYVAVSQRWEEVGVHPPEGWIIALLARCYGHPYETADHLPIDTEMPHRERRPDEDIYSDFVSDWPRDGGRST